MAKVIASSLRKGNVVDLDGKLYVVLTAQNIHPGKGTPVTQLDLRRISDGVKISERYRTTEQVERAFVESQEHSFLYEDGEGFHFMNPESYEQVVVHQGRDRRPGRSTCRRAWPACSACTRASRSRSSCRSG